MTSDRGTEPESTRAGDVALVGRPNVGKSSLLNALTGETLSIVTPRAQTTRERVRGIYTDATSQLVFVDTPGLLEPSYLFQRSMLQEALTAVRETDLVLLLLDATRPQELPGGEVRELLLGRGDALHLAINKIDAVPAATVASLAAAAREGFGREPHRISATNGSGVERLRQALVEALPVSPFLYPADEVAVQSLRFFVSELIRETVFERYEDEIPYATVVRIEDYREAASPVYIRATVYVERASQKAIVLGRGGAGIRALGGAARAKIEALVGERVFLDLWVKVLPGWRRKRSTLEYLGYPVPSGSPSGE